ncbi:uncharacterized protein LOC122788674 [Protopterus annectens]|uniref:uncharacterized protein LOC122788674 n=1 Tax=Protopterus annectens TaxID=7888 RepID=UPI001CF97FCB|nr:uncharacterized protein LOC122788674 [Protopterus annectens]
MSAHSARKIALLILTAIIYSITVLLNAGNGAEILKGLFHGTVGNVSDRFITKMTPVNSTFAIWGLIFFWQAIWIIYALSGICRRTELGWMYIKPDLLPDSFYMVWILNNLIIIGWLFLWDREYLVAALVFLVGIAVTNYVTLFISHRALHSHSTWLQSFHKTDIWLIRILVQNGIALYATWTTIASLLNFVIVLIYCGNVSHDTACIAVLSILLFLIILWFYLENFLLDKYVRYTLTVYPVIITALTGILYRNYSLTSKTQIYIYSAVLLALVCTILVIRLVIVIWRHIKRPLYKAVRLPNSEAILENK